MATEVDGFLHIARAQHRNAQVDQGDVAAGGQGAALRARVFTHQCHGTAAGRSAGHHGVAQGIAGPVETRPLAIPEPDHAIVLGRAQARTQLRAHHGRGSKLFVQAGLEHIAVPIGLGQRCSHGEITVETGQRAARVAGHVRGGIPPVAAIDAQLFEGKASQCLRAAQEHPARVETVAIVDAVARGGCCRGLGGT